MRTRLPTCLSIGLGVFLIIPLSQWRTSPFPRNLVHVKRESASAQRNAARLGAGGNITPVAGFSGWRHLKAPEVAATAPLRGRPASPRQSAPRANARKQLVR